MFKKYYIAFIGLSIFNQLGFATTLDCCVQHKGVCGDTCCDDTPIPASCGDFQIIKLPPRAAPSPQISKQDVPLSLKQPLKRLYVWHDLQTGTRYLSNTFPPWYRNPLYQSNYPRTLVYDEYNRLIDDTGKQLSAVEVQKRREEAELNQQQHAAYQKAKKKQAELKAKQAQLGKLLELWVKNGKVTEEMTTLLEALAAEKQVTMAMTEEQVQQAWGVPQSTINTVVDGIFQKTLTYQKGEVILVDGRVKSLKMK